MAKSMCHAMPCAIPGHGNENGNENRIEWNEGHSGKCKKKIQWGGEGNLQSVDCCVVESRKENVSQFV